MRAILCGAFPIEPFARHCLLHGLDELGYLRSKLHDIERFEAAQAAQAMQAPRPGA